MFSFLERFLIWFKLKTDWKKQKNENCKRKSESRIEPENWTQLQTCLLSGSRTVSNNGSGSGLAFAQNILAVQVWFGFIWAPFSRFRFGSGSRKQILLVQVRFEFMDLKFNCRYSLRPEKKRRNCWSCWWSPLLLLCVYQRQRHPDMEKYILTFVSGSGSVWVHLSTIPRVQVWFRFTEVKFFWFRFGSGSPKWSGSFGFTVRVQVRFDTLPAIPSVSAIDALSHSIISFQTWTKSACHHEHD